MSTSHSRLRASVKFVLAASALVAFIQLLTGPVDQPVNQRPGRLTARVRPVLVEPQQVDQPLPCSQLPGADETVVIMKTGATELRDKLPVHFDTTLRCYPNHLIFSDYEEEYKGYHIIDALDSVDRYIRNSSPDFELWRRLQRHGRGVLTSQELSGPGVKLSGGLGKPENPGWKLDKWKFLPMINRTYHEYPDKKWFVFVETDTYIFWSGTLAWLSGLDHTQPHYLGAQMQIGEVVFAHGGSAFVISQAGMRAAVSVFLARQRDWEDFTDGHWAGDCVLGKALADSGTPLTWAWPIFQGTKPGGINYAHYDYFKRLWCHPTISYHHLSPPEIDDIWQYEQSWLANTTAIVRHKDVYNSYILPNIIATGDYPKDDWDNLSGSFVDAPSANSIEDCRFRCKAIAECLQYSFSAGRCVMSEVPKMGERSVGVQSGWFPERATQFAENMPACGGEGWIG